MPQRTVRFKIPPDGRVEERVQGVLGDGCQQLTERLEAALGSVERREDTAEAFLSNESQDQTLPAQIT